MSNIIIFVIELYCKLYCNCITFYYRANNLKNCNCKLIKISIYMFNLHIHIYIYIICKYIYSMLQNLSINYFVYDDIMIRYKPFCYYR